MGRRQLVVGLVVCIGLAVYTSFKLHRMTRIVDQDGVSERVTSKTVEEGRRADVCYFWVPVDERVQSDCDYWEGVAVGETIEVVTVDGEKYVKGGSVYASKGNFVFDIVLLVAEIIGALVFVVLLVRSRATR